MEQTNTLLKIENLSVYYGPICAVKKIDLEVKQGEIVAVLGANGAGKSTMVNTIIGLMKAKTGSIQFDGKELTKMRTDQIIQSGISVVPEGRGMLSEMTVMENLQMGVYHHKVDFNSNLEMIFSYFPRLKERQWQKAGTLSGGEQQMLAIGRSIIGGPKLLLMDELSLALSPLYVDNIFKTLVQLRNEKGFTILLAEQNARKALQYSDRAYVLDLGKTVMDGRSSELMDDPFVQKAYLGA
ncbi:MAG: ABC transporter ATP-binding protein [Parasporobacterium sp.]|nr:ABC transporter ATP-binding protein [Parasporobacterium sp.]MBQ9032984.1 ABC transporter ATP-binding protein [Parasporobacterium sp.]